MRKQKQKATMIIKRKNQNKRIKQRNANKKLPRSFTKKVMDGEFIVRDTIQPYSKALWPNQAQP